MINEEDTLTIWAISRYHNGLQTGGQQRQWLFEISREAETAENKADDAGED